MLLDFSSTVRAVLLAYGTIPETRLPQPSAWWQLLGDGAKIGVIHVKLRKGHKPRSAGCHRRLEKVREMILPQSLWRRASLRP